MAQQGLKILGTTRQVELDGEQTLATISGIDFKQYACLVYTSGNGNTSGTQSVPVSKLLPPSTSTSNVAHSCGLVDLWQENRPSPLAASNSSTTTTGAGSFSNFAGGNFSNSRPFMVGILGDGTATTTYSLKMAGVTKNNIVPSAEVSGTNLSLKMLGRMI